MEVKAILLEADEGVVSTYRVFLLKVYVAFTGAAEADVGLVGEGHNVVDNLGVFRPSVQLLEDREVAFRLLVCYQLDLFAVDFDAIWEGHQAELAVEGFPAVRVSLSLDSGAGSTFEHPHETAKVDVLHCPCAMTD